MICIQLAGSIIEQFNKVPEKYPKHMFPILHYLTNAAMISLGLIIKEPSFRERYGVLVVRVARALNIYCRKTWVSGKMIRTISTLGQMVSSTLGSSTRGGSAGGSASTLAFLGSPDQTVNRAHDPPKARYLDTTDESSSSSTTRGSSNVSLPPATAPAPNQASVSAATFNASLGGSSQTQPQRLVDLRTGRSNPQNTTALSPSGIPSTTQAISNTQNTSEALSSFDLLSEDAYYPPTHVNNEPSPLSSGPSLPDLVMTDFDFEQMIGGSALDTFDTTTHLWDSGPHQYDLTRPAQDDNFAPEAAWNAQFLQALWGPQFQQ